MHCFYEYMKKNVLIYRLKNLSRIIDILIRLRNNLHIKFVLIATHFSLHRKEKEIESSMQVDAGRCKFVQVRTCTRRQLLRVLSSECPDFT